MDRGEVGDVLFAFVSSRQEFVDPFEFAFEVELSSEREPMGPWKLLLDRDELEVLKAVLASGRNANCFKFPTRLDDDFCPVEVAFFVTSPDFSVPLDLEDENVPESLPSR
jgi:hypothetical protein